MTIPADKNSKEYREKLFGKHEMTESRIIKYNQIADELQRLGGVRHSLSRAHLKTLFGDEFDFYAELDDKQLNQWLKHLKTIQHKDEFTQPVKAIANNQ